MDHGVIHHSIKYTVLFNDYRFNFLWVFFFTNFVFYCDIRLISRCIHNNDYIYYVWFQPFVAVSCIVDTLLIALTEI